MSRASLSPLNRAGRVDQPRPDGFDDFVDDDGLDLRHYWRVLLHYKWGIAGLVVGATLFTLVWAFSLERVYRSTATITIGGGAESIAVSEIGEAKSGLGSGQFFNTQLEVLRSREVALTVLDRLRPRETAAILARLERDGTPAFDWRGWVPPSMLEKLNIGGRTENWTDNPLQRGQSPDDQVYDDNNIDSATAGPPEEFAHLLAGNAPVNGAKPTSLVEAIAAQTQPGLPSGASGAPKTPVEANPTQRQFGPASYSFDADQSDSSAEPNSSPIEPIGDLVPNFSADLAAGGLQSEGAVPEGLDGLRDAGAIEGQAAADGELVSPRLAELDAEQRKLLGWLNANLSVEPVRKTAMVKVSFETWSPQLAARVANAFTEAFVEYNLRQRRESTTLASAWLKDQLEKANRHVQESVDQLQEHREAAGLVNLSGLHSLQTEQLKESAAALSRAQRDRSEAEGLYQRARSLQQSGRLDAIPHVRENGWIQELRRRAEELERQIQADEARYTDAYPALVDARDQLSAVRRQIGTAMATVVDGFRTNYEMALANEKKLQQEVETLEAGVRELDRRQLQARALEQSLTTNRQYYDAFLEKLMETSTRQEDTVSMVAQVVDRAVPVMTPVKPNKKRMVMMGMILSLMVGIGIALLLDKLDSTLKRREDVEDRLGIPVLGELMLLPKRRADGAEMRPPVEFVDEPTSAFAEDIRTIRTGVALSGMDQSAQTLVVTSTVSGEGKSTLALNLAMALGQLGTVLLIDADMRRPSVAKNLGFEERGPGVTDLVAGTVKVADCVRDYEPGGIHVLPAGSTLPPDPLKVLSSERFAQLLDTAAETYHAVVVDSAPVELVSDARVLATKATGVLYVIRADDTSQQAVRRGLGSLAETGAPLLGAVLNQIDPKAAKSYGYYKYGRGAYGSYGGKYGGRYGADVYGRDAANAEDVVETGLDPVKARHA